MDFSTINTAPERIKTDALIVGIHTDAKLPAATAKVDDASNGAISALLPNEFSGKTGEILVLRQLAGVTAPRVIVVGLGDPTKFNATVLQQAHRAALTSAQGMNLPSVATALLTTELDADLTALARQTAMAAGLAAYRFDPTYGREKPKPQALKQLAIACGRGQNKAVNEGLTQGQAIANGMNLTRELGNLPSNICTPSYLASTARALGRSHKLKIEVLDRKQLEALKMGAFLAVAKGSEEAPKFIVMRHEGVKTGARAKDKASAPIVLVGKGITFDTGGISLKPGASMDEMKYDMCGAASVFGTMKAIAELALPINVVGVVPACENMPSGRATKPGDVVTTMSGLTVEILNTDAEGRLILCDALTYAERFKPRAVVNVATLTGACVVALGHVNTGLFANNAELSETLRQASIQANDPAWPMPLDDAYQDQLKSNFADMANIGGRDAGAITAACFLSRFTKSYPWAHLDIAGTAWVSGKDKGASGRPVPMLVQYLLSQC
ncbi:MAG: leucyl aminopeptidase [Pigmentiphaga sp.]|nr:leucyl aminopeptidase [Pigmentiphaga sp.]